MMTGFVTVSKEEAKKMIDASPCDEITIAIFDMKTRFHLPTERKEKRIGKEIIELAKEVGYQNNDFFGVIGCKGGTESEKSLIRNIMFPMRTPPKRKK